MTFKQSIINATLPASTSAIIKPEFGPLPSKGHDPVTGFSRSMCYVLERAGLIRFVRIRQPGNILGRVLIDYESVRQYFAKLATGQGPSHAEVAANPA